MNGFILPSNSSRGQPLSSGNLSLALLGFLIPFGGMSRPGPPMRSPCPKKAVAQGGFSARQDCGVEKKSEN